MNPIVTGHTRIEVVRRQLRWQFAVKFPITQQVLLQGIEIVRGISVVLEQPNPEITPLHRRSHGSRRRFGEQFHQTLGHFLHTMCADHGAAESVFNVFGNNKVPAVIEHCSLAFETCQHQRLVMDWAIADPAEQPLAPPEGFAVSLKLLFQAFGTVPIGEARVCGVVEVSQQRYHSVFCDQLFNGKSLLQQIGQNFDVGVSAEAVASELSLNLSRIET